MGWKSREREEACGFVRAYRRQNPCSVSIDKCQDKRPKGPKIADDSSGNTKLRRAKEQRVSKGESRDRAESWREKTRGREKMPKKEISGGGGEETARRQSERARETWPVRRKLPSGGVAESASFGYDPILSPPDAGNSLLLLSHPARKHVGLALTTRCGESTSRVSILGLHERQLHGRLERQRAKRGLLWPRSRVFVIIAASSVAFEILLVYRLLGLFGECYYALFEVCLFLISRGRHLCISHD